MPRNPLPEEGRLWTTAEVFEEVAVVYLDIADDPNMVMDLRTRVCMRNIAADLRRQVEESRCPI